MERNLVEVVEELKKLNDRLAVLEKRVEALVLTSGRRGSSLTTVRSEVKELSKKVKKYANR